jgi:hypothetical protein
MQANGPRIIVESLKLLALVGGFFILQNQILGVRYDVYDGKAVVAHAELRGYEEQEALREQVEVAFSVCTADLLQARQQLELTLKLLDRERESLRDVMDFRTGAMESSVRGWLESEQSQLETLQFSVETDTARLDRVYSSLWKSPDEMKRRMIYPTVQLKGNGTVGSGVIVYSEPQPDLGSETSKVYATFILTAYHVVLEVMGDRSDSGVVEQIYVLATDQEVEVLHEGKLVLFDRDRDLALLRLNARYRFDQVAQLMPIEELDSVDVFARAYAVGCPLGNRPLPTIGEISSKSKVVSDQTLWMLSAPTFFGNSGGGVYLAENCCLIGVSSMIYTYGRTHPAVVPHMGLFVPLKEIYGWFDAEGYSFVHERRAIPREMLWKLAYREEGEAGVLHATAGPDEE